MTWNECQTEGCKRKVNGYGYCEKCQNQSIQAEKILDRLGINENGSGRR